jgi:hypothetical protein
MLQERSVCKWSISLLKWAWVKAKPLLVPYLSCRGASSCLVIMGEYIYWPEGTRAMLSLQVRNSNRTALFSFVGTPRPGKPGDMRMELIEQCNASARCTSQTAQDLMWQKPTSSPFCFHGRRFLLATQGWHSNEKISFWLHDCWVHTHILSHRFCIYAV